MNMRAYRRTGHHSNNTNKNTNRYINNNPLQKNNKPHHHKTNLAYTIAASIISLQKPSNNNKSQRVIKAILP